MKAPTLLKNNIAIRLLVASMASAALLPKTLAQGFVQLSPFVSVEAIDPYAAEPGPEIDRGTIAFRRTGSVASDLRVHFVVGGSASNGVDYAAISNSAVIPAGQSMVEVVIDPLDDLLPDGRETVRFQVVLPPDISVIDPYNLPHSFYLPGYPSEATVFIADNDGGPTNHPPTISIVHPIDGQTYPNVPVFLAANTADADGRVIRIDFYEGANHVAATTNLDGLSILHFAEGFTASTWLDTVVNGQTNPILAPLVVFPSLAVWNPEPGEYELTALATDNDGASTLSAPVHVTVSELPVVTIHARDAHASEPIFPFRTNSAEFTIRRTGPTDDALTVFVNVSGTATLTEDYNLIVGDVPTPGPIVPLFFMAIIPSGSSSTELIVHPVRDGIAEETETVTASLTLGPFALYDYPYYYPASPYSLNGTGYAFGSQAQATIYIHDRNGGPRNHLPRVRLLEPLHRQTFAAGSTIPLLATTSDRETYVWKIEFFDGVRKIGELQDLSQPEEGHSRAFSWIWTEASPGWHTLRARVTDTQGGIQISPPVKIRVQPAAE